MQNGMPYIPTSNKDRSSKSDGYNPKYNVKAWVYTCGKDRWPKYLVKYLRHMPKVFGFMLLYQQYPKISLMSLSKLPLKSRIKSQSLLSQAQNMSCLTNQTL